MELRRETRRAVHRSAYAKLAYCGEARELPVRVLQYAALIDKVGRACILRGA